jgi:hypothetical protein
MKDIAEGNFPARSDVGAPESMSAKSPQSVNGERAECCGKGEERNAVCRCGARTKIR